MFSVNTDPTLNILGKILEDNKFKMFWNYLYFHRLEREVKARENVILPPES